MPFYTVVHYLCPTWCGENVFEQILRSTILKPLQTHWVQKGCNPHGWYTTTWTYIPPGLEEMCKELFVAEQFLRSTPFVEHLVCNLTCALAHDAYFVHTCNLILKENFGYMYDIILLVLLNSSSFTHYCCFHGNVRDEFQYGLTLLNSHRCSGCGRVDKYSVVGDGM